MTQTISYAQQELELYFNNEEWLIRPCTIAIGKAHRQRETFDYERALKFLERRMIDGAKQYTREHGSLSDSWQRLFPLADRKAAAESVLQSMLQEFALGNYWTAK